MAGRVRQAIELSGLYQRDIAAMIGVTTQAVSGWARTGKISKDHLPGFAKITGVRAHWLMTGEGFPRNHVIQTQRVEEFPRLSEQANKTLAYLGSLAQAGTLQDSDFIFIETMVRQFIVGRNLQAG